MKCQELKRMYETLGAAATVRRLREAIDAKHLAPEDFSVRQLAEALIPDGREFVNLLGPQKSGGFRIMEAGDAVDLATFSNITGQIVFSKVQEAFEMDYFIGEQLVTVQQTQFSGEKIPGMGRIGDEAEVVDESKPYPLAGFNEEYVETPATTKRGLIVPVSKETIFFDRTNLLLQRAGEVGEFLGLNKEKRILDTVLGITNTYKRNGTTTNTYLAAGAYVNVQAANALVDWQQIEKAELLLDGITDPNTGEAVLVAADTIIVPSALKYTAMRILNATEVRHVDNTVAAGRVQTLYANPLTTNYNIVSSRLVRQRVGDSTTWFLGAPKKAFAYMQNWPITVVQAPNNSEAEFMQDIVVRYKASERGVPAVLEPRYMVRCTA